MRTLPELPPLAHVLGVSLRPMTEADRPFLQQLYVSTRWEEVQAAGWSEQTCLTFLNQQAQFQYLSYIALPDTHFGILEADGGPVGRLFLRRVETDELRVVDVSLLPAWRGRGLGGALLRQVQETARREARFVSIHVERNNPARRLYARLGFERVEEGAVYDLMRWDPPAVQPNTT